METIFKSELPELKLVHHGKVREVFELDDILLFVASDRISAFDVIMDTPIPNKGKILSKFLLFGLVLLKISLTIIL